LFDEKTVTVTGYSSLNSFKMTTLIQAVQSYNYYGCTFSKAAVMFTSSVARKLYHTSNATINVVWYVQLHGATTFGSTIHVLLLIQRQIWIH